MNRELIDIGSKNLEVSILGKGDPTVVIETGLGCSFDNWYDIVQEISKETTVLTYHRGGYGISTLGEEERTTMQIAEDLHCLLKIMQVEFPVILVGHSFGGLCVQQYAMLYPEEIGAMMLIDSVSCDEYKMDKLRESLSGFKKQFSKEGIVKSWLKLSEKSKEELEEEINPKLLEDQLKFPPEIQRELLDFAVKPNLYKAMASELKNMSQSGEKMKLKDKLQVPLKVLCRDMELGVKWNIDSGIPEDESRVFEKEWQRLVKAQADLSTKGEFQMIDNSKHSIYRTNPQKIIGLLNELIRDLKTLNIYKCDENNIK